MSFSIAELSRLTGVAAPTIRMWEERHGFPVPQRLPSGHRRYTADDAERVRAVVAARDSGLSLAAAIGRAGAGEAGRGQSIHSLLRLRRPELAPERVPKPRLVALSHAIEDECVQRAQAPVLVGSFQSERFYRRAEPRWRGFARTAAVAVALADFRTDMRRRPIEVGVDPAHPLTQEWAVVCHSPGVSACLSGWEPPGQDGVPDDEREFELIWTVDPELVHEAALAAADVAEAASPEAADMIRTALGPPPPPSTAEVRSVAALARRMVAYVTMAR